MKKNTKKGFTLVELVIVIAVIAILSAILIPTFGDIISNANETAYQKAANSAFTEAMEKASKVEFDYAIVVYYDGGLTRTVNENTGSTTVTISARGNATRAYKINSNNQVTLLDEKVETSEYEANFVTVEGKMPTITTAVTTFKDLETEANIGTWSSQTADNYYYVNDKCAIAFFKDAA